MTTLKPINWPAVMIEPTPKLKRGPGRPFYFEEKMTRQELRKRERDAARIARTTNIAILDMETDPFDDERKETIKPFLAVLYRDDAEPVVIWEEDEDEFIAAVIRAIEELPGRFTIYAHNGGKFDYMFLIKRLRGRVSFKGRGLMCARIGKHEIRDSFHIIPERLANWQKDSFDYAKLKRNVRHKWRAEIIRYCINDCRYLLDIVKKFIGDYGLKLSIGQAAQSVLRESYKVERMGEQSDAFLRNYFFGGRVECLRGRGWFGGILRGLGYALYDVNSMYPDRMAACRHPIGNSFNVRSGAPTDETIFLELTCRNFGALVKRGEDGEVTADFASGTFRTTIWEYQTALKYGLIENVKIKWCIDFPLRSDFSLFINPLYEKRQATKRALKLLTPGSHEFNDKKKDDIFYKLILNNAYGKFAQNPRRFKECHITDPEERPSEDNDIQQQLVDAGREKSSWGVLPTFECKDYWIWERPQKFHRFNNVATAASITGAARAKLMEAIHLAIDPIYCDTDSVICRGMAGMDLHEERLGAWKKEYDLDEVLIAGKKLYACKVAGLPDGHKDRIKVRSKGVAGLTWEKLERMIADEVVTMVNPAPTMNKRGDQFYMRRNVRATVGRNVSRIVKRKGAVA